VVTPSIQIKPQNMRNVNQRIMLFCHVDACSAVFGPAFLKSAVEILASPMFTEISGRFGQIVFQVQRSATVRKPLNKGSACGLYSHGSISIHRVPSRGNDNYHPFIMNVSC